MNPAPSPAACHDSVVSLQNVSFAYEQHKVIDGLTLNVLQRDFVGLIGANGAGKSTLLKMIVGLIRPDAGEVRLFGTPIGQFREWERIGYVPQKNTINPLFPATVREVVMSGLYGRKTLFRRLTAAQRLRCEEAMHAMAIEDIGYKRIGRLSGGQQQRVLLARALVNNPDLLVLDEPTVGIDAETQAGFFHLIRHLHRHHRIAFLMVSHDTDMLKSYLGSEPVVTSGKLKFYVKHSHETEDCADTGVDHPLKQPLADDKFTAREELGGR